MCSSYAAYGEAVRASRSIPSDTGMDELPVSCRISVEKAMTPKRKDKPAQRDKPQDEARPMSDSKKPTLSEIKAFQKRCPVSTADEAFLFDNCAHLLGLVERMEETLKIYDAEHSGCSCPACSKARELLKEIKQ